MSNADDVLKQIQEEAKQNVSELRWVRTCQKGDEIRQGDIYLYALDEEPEHGGSARDRQLAPGSSRGSRHVVEGPVRIYRVLAADPLTGPVIHALERVVVTHPEHAHVSLPAGWYEVRYQRDFEASDGMPGIAREQRRLRRSDPRYGAEFLRRVQD